MSILIPATLTRTLPLGTFDTVRQLLQQMAQLPGALLLSEEATVPTDAIAAELPQRFTLFVSEQFSALLWVQGEGEGEGEGEGHRENRIFSIQHPKSKVQNSIVPKTLLNVGLSFDPEAIASFGFQLCDIHAREGVEFSTSIDDFQAIRRVLQTIKPNNAVFQSEFTLQLLEILAAESYVKADDFSACKSVEEAFYSQLEQERLLNQVTTQIRQSLELPTILSTAVEQLQKFLQVDRLLIYQFEDRENEIGDRENKLNLQGGKSRTSKKLFGRVTYEALANEKISSVLNLTEGLNCFPDVPNHSEKYRKGFTKGVADIETAYKNHSCFLEFMRLCQVRAKLVVPIVVQEELWGLLIAHQCFEVREWEESKKTFLRQITEHLAIAIYQAELYAELQQQKHTLEQRVIKRTQELQDALAAAQSANITKTEFLNYNR
ncbi:MAG TPA: GAF domain-containing protein, partial [Kamptonema sp.]|nr:GAF domain-containing protein [Kamptonema sp.]